LVDALASGASGGNPVEVQVLSSAPHFFPIIAEENFYLTNKNPGFNAGVLLCANHAQFMVLLESLHIPVR
jgi:hypothetical protein